MNAEQISNHTEASYRRRTAFHESGHAVVGWALGCPVGWVRLSSAGNGTAEIAKTLELAPVDQIAIWLAGHVAGRMCGEPRQDDLCSTRDCIEAYNVSSRAHREDDDAQERLMRDGLRRARRLLAQHWKLVARVSADLECYGALGLGVVAMLADLTGGY